MSLDAETIKKAVKPIQWTTDGHRHFGVAPPLGVYTIADGYLTLYLRGNIVCQPSSLDEAKAAAQADYEARIISALSPEFLSALDTQSSRTEAMRKAAPAAYAEKDGDEWVMYWPDTDGVYEHIRDYPDVHKGGGAIPLYRHPPAPRDELVAEVEPRSKRWASDLSDEDLRAEQMEVEATIAGGFGERSGSPGEWYYERADEVFREIVKRSGRPMAWVDVDAVCAWCFAKTWFGEYRISWTFSVDGQTLTYPDGASKTFKNREDAKSAAQSDLDKRRAALEGR